MSGPAREPRSGTPAGRPAAPDRTTLMQQHAEARRRREQAPLGSEAFRAAAEEVARIEIAIAELEEPPPDRPAA